MEQREFNKLHLIRLGKILNNFTILGLVYMLLTALVPVLSFLCFIIVGVIFILSIFPWILSGFQLDIGKIVTWFNQDFFNQIIVYLNAYLPYVFGFSAAFAVLSATILLFDKNEKHIGRIVVAVLALVVGIIAMIIRGSGGAV